MDEGNAPRPALLVSACLLGVPCNHRGAPSPAAAVEELRASYRLVAVCPESAGGLPTPRPAADQRGDGRVITADGADVTDAYEGGAACAVALARATGARGAVLKARSPSCGCGQVYDGTFTRTLVDGEGVTARALRRASVAVCSDEDVELGRVPVIGWAPGGPAGPVP